MVFPHVCLVRGVEKWKGRKLFCLVGEKKGRMENLENRKVLVFSHVCLVRGVEKWESRKLFCLIREKCGRMENVVYMN